MIPPASDRLDLSKLSEWAPELARTFVALSSDIALVIDAGGVIRSVEQGQAEPIAPTASAWVGRSWVDTVSGDTRAKVEKLLREVASDGLARRREVNHSLRPGVTVPVAYTAVRLGDNGPVLAVGRDMRAIVAIQERFIESQQDMERGYWHARRAESHDRLLLQVGTDAVMVVDPETLLIGETNPAAMRLFAGTGDELIGKHAGIGFAHSSRGAIHELLALARSSGQSGEIRARLLGSIVTTSVSATSFRADDAMRLLVRVRAIDATGNPAPGRGAAGAEPLFASADGSSGSSGDGTVVTDSSGRILLASPAFLRLAGLPGEADAKGRLLADWLGTSARPLSGLLSRVRRQGVVRSFSTGAKQAHGPEEAVDISASLLTEGDQECIGFTIHRVAVPHDDAALVPTLGAELERLAERIGELPLAPLLAEAAMLVERHFVALARRRIGSEPARADSSAS